MQYKQTKPCSDRMWLPHLARSTRPQYTDISIPLLRYAHTFPRRVVIRLLVTMPSPLQLQLQLQGLHATPRLVCSLINTLEISDHNFIAREQYY
jgi:hypothetical protein